MLPDYSNNQLKIVFIGCGSIAEYHYNVFTALGVDVVAASATTNSKHLKSFVAKHKISGYTSNKQLIESEQPDAIVVLSSWKATEKVIDEIIGYNLPILVEKPVALKPIKIEKWLKNYPQNSKKIQVGFNRRFYDFVPEVKNWIKNNTIASIEVHVSEPYREGLNKQEQDELFLANSCHPIDLLYFLLGKSPLQVEYVSKRNKGIQGYNAIFKSKSKGPIHLIANWGSPTKFGITFHGIGNKLELSPLEEVRIYEGMEVTESGYVGMRSYSPKVTETYYNDNINDFKPGFLGQSINFIETAVLGNVKNTQGCSLKDALVVTELMAEIKC